MTPDSFSGDGLLRDTDYVARALAQAEKMVADGATILDIGGESTRPGASPVLAKEEIRRIVPVIEAIKKRLPDSLKIAVDTTKASVAEAALEAGATIINDISALRNDAEMAKIALKYGAAVVLMHNQAMPDLVQKNAKIGGSYEAPAYKNIIPDVIDHLKECVAIAVESGIAREKIILDPGIGFGKTVQQNLTLIARLGEIKALGFPVLAGLSRKSFIGHVLDASVEDRLEGTAACLAVAVMQGADILRVHDVKCAVRISQMAAALRNSMAKS
ncbi:MAG: dihydropteroate synthase [Alphaproteobacteria bacterium]|nr:dihydropteroate synthase [Alphaproteobacteria bacterium]